MPNGDIVTDQQLYDFPVNRRHPRQAGHAELFYRLLGIDASNAERLRVALLEATSTAVAEPGKPSEFGEKYEIRFPMTGPRGTFTILSVWMIRRGESDPRLVTAYPDVASHETKTSMSMIWSPCCTTCPKSR